MTIRELMNWNRPSTLTVRRGVNPVFALQDEMNRLLGDFFGESFPTGYEAPASVQAYTVAPPMEVKDTKDAVEISAELPGIDPKDIDLSITDQYVTLKGEKKAESEEKEGNYYRRERAYGSFQRAVALPDTANSEKAEASFKNGVLTIRIPKTAEAKGKTRKLEVKTAA